MASEQMAKKKKEKKLVITLDSTVQRILFDGNPKCNEFRRRDWKEDRRIREIRE